MPITIDLKKLTSLFARSAADETLPNPIRRFSAQLTLLSAHLNRVDEKIDAEVKARTALDGHVAEVADHLLALRSTAAAPPASPSTTQGPPVGEQPAEDDDAEAMAARVLAETDTEIDAINSGAPTQAIVPTQKPRPSAGGAA